MNNLILTTCANYQVKDLEKFFISLARHVTNYQCVVFTHNLAPATMLWLREQGAVLLPMRIGGWQRGIFNRYLKFTNANLLRFLPGRVAMRLAFHTAPIMSLRFLYYHEWFCRHAKEFEKVFITDLRDVVFQDDLFPLLQKDEVQFFLENQEIGCANDVNRIWLDAIYARKKSEFLDGLVTSCAGTTLGSASAIKFYLDKMVGEIIGADGYLHYGEDQAMHNMILRRESADFARNPVPNAEGAVLTVLSIPPQDYQLGPDDLVRDKSGRVIPVLHTYDRFPELLAAQHRRLGIDPVR